jgi:hypothetical protein
MPSLPHHFIDMRPTPRSQLWSIEYTIEAGEIDLIEVFSAAGTKMSIKDMDLDLYNRIIEHINENHGGSL